MLFRSGSTAGGQGGSGIVIVRFPSNYANANVTGSPTFANVGGYKYYTFASTGTITFQ